MKSSSAQEHISNLEKKIDESARRHGKEISDLTQTLSSLQAELRQRRQELNQETHKSETLVAESTRLKVELARVENMYKQRTDSLEKELLEVRAKAQRSAHDLDAMAVMASNSSKSGEKFEVEIKLLNSQITSLVCWRLLRLEMINYDVN